MANMEEMEELHMAARAYFRNASDGLRRRAREFFDSMDTNGDGDVSFNELNRFFVQNGYNRVPLNFFQRLDRDGNGFLDFFEVLTFYYIVKTRVVLCACCRNYQMGRYFTCVRCFDNARSTGRTYDLCPTCYEERRHPHRHNYFLDNYVLLRVKAGLPPLAGAPDMWCCCCGNYLMGLYFACITCYNNARSTGYTYNLCSMCYKARRHQQQHPHHNRFLDSYVLLRVKAGFRPFAGAPNFQQALVPRRAPSTSQQRMRTTFQALEMGVTVLNTGVIVVNTAVTLDLAGCSIM